MFIVVSKSSDTVVSTFACGVNGSQIATFFWLSEWCHLITNHKGSHAVSRAHVFEKLACGG